MWPFSVKESSYAFTEAQSPEACRARSGASSVIAGELGSGGEEADER